MMPDLILDRVSAWLQDTPACLSVDDKWHVAALILCRADPAFADCCTSRLLGLEFMRRAGPLSPAEEIQLGRLEKLAHAAQRRTVATE